ncbi:MAG: hypothetical protein IPP26_08270 [Flavobacteriales bacterium]|nr:hypothetical protein [Flavobacteriales bacterium]
MSATVTVEGGTSASAFGRKLDMLCGLLLEGRAKNHGFLWEYHADWMIAVKNAGHTEAVAYLAYASTDDKDVKSWIKDNGDKDRCLLRLGEGLQCGGVEGETLTCRFNYVRPSASSAVHHPIA